MQTANNRIGVGTDSDPGVSVLFARDDSCYFKIVDDVWTKSRDARQYKGRARVVAHPPCRCWGRYAKTVVPEKGEAALAVFAVRKIWEVGGVLEHPSRSSLWRVMGLPVPAGGFSDLDAHGGFTAEVMQSWWGHAAPKPTWLYVCGMSMRSFREALPVARIDMPPGRIQNMGRAEREASPPAFAEWLVGIASRCWVGKVG